MSSEKLESFPDGFFYFEESNTILLLHRRAHTVLRSTDAGVHWKPVTDIDEGHAYDIFSHPIFPKVAYILGKEKKHWITEDQGESWRKFESPAVPFAPPMVPPLSFHASDPNKVIVHTMSCRSRDDCEEEDYYTTDGFKNVGLLRKGTKHCVFAHSTALFEVSKDDEHDNRIICRVLGRYSSRRKDERLVVSDHFFQKDDEIEPYLDGDRTVPGIIKMAVVKGFILAAAKSEKSDELALFVTKDGKHWHRAEFPSEHRLDEDAYTILESTDYSIQVDVMTTTIANPMGVLFTSNSNGTYFTKNIRHTNRNRAGNVDFEKIQNIEGIVLVNVVDNYEEVEKSPRVEKKLKTKISFDDGRSFREITCDQEVLHLHSVSDISNFGRIFSSPAPGLVMGVGNTGKYLKDYNEGDLYVSDDAGLTWRLALKEAHKYEFGDQGAVLVAIYDEGPTEKIMYSIDHGKSWKEQDLGHKVTARILTTRPDSTSLQFLLLATVGHGQSRENYIFSIDFEGVHKRVCEKKDFEDWYARYDDGKPGCIMGRTQAYPRRKADADCFVDEESKEPKPEFERCPCSEEDFECDYNFELIDDECILRGPLSIPSGECKKPDDHFKASSGYRLIPGNKCIQKSGSVNKEKEIDRPCKDSAKKPISGKISSEITFFRASRFKEHFYLERTLTSTGDDQTVVMLTDRNDVYLTQDHGKTWRKILEDKGITEIYPHQYFDDIAYFLTGADDVYYTVNRGANFEHFKAPKGPTRDKRLAPLSFHADHKGWLIWTGAVDCKSEGSSCHDVAYISEDRGNAWKEMLSWVRKCEFIKKENSKRTDKLIYCEQREDEKRDGPLQLLSSENWFYEDAKKNVHFTNIVDFATKSEFIIVAVKDNDNLKVDASVDGKTFADALFPPNFQVPHQSAYTVLDSSTGAVFLHVTVETRENGEYGSIIKSNSNGTSYVLSIDRVNRNKEGYVDFEKMLGLQGVAIANAVDNIDELEKGKPKKLKTYITHNDGAQWSLIPAPQKDVLNHDYGCDSQSVEKCSLHLHGYTERDDPRHTYSSASAVGLMMGVGNVGEFLGRKSEGDTFITRDGGMNWHSVKKGNYMWEYGNQGSIIVIVKKDVATKTLFFSRDEGDTWEEFVFADSEMNIFSISSVPSDTSRNFLLWGKETKSDNQIATVNLDFTGLTDKQCVLNDDDPNADDYYIWEPMHPNLKDDHCLFGQVTQYPRKRTDRDCYNNPRIRDWRHVAKDCQCTREDFEWYVAHP